MTTEKKRMNKWVLWGVIFLVILIVLWLSLALFWEGETAGVVMETGEVMQTDMPAR